MKKYTVTISREFGCGAREIGNMFAKRLGVVFYDKDLIDMTAQRAGVRREAIQDFEEEVQADEVKRLLREFGYGSSTLFYSDAAINVQAEIIRELAEKQSAVFFGRCSDYILRDIDNCFNIFLYAPIEERVKHIATEYNLSVKKAEKLIGRVDRQRHNYYKYVTGSNRGDRAHNSLMLDVSRFGKEGSVEMMVDACKLLFGPDILSEE